MSRDRVLSRQNLSIEKHFEHHNNINMEQNLVLNFIINEIIRCIYNNFNKLPKFYYNKGGKWAISVEIKVGVAKAQNLGEKNLGRGNYLRAINRNRFWLSIAKPIC